MAHRRGPQRPSPLQPDDQPGKLNGRTARKVAPQSEREWRIFRSGVLEGVELAHRDAHEKAGSFLLRIQCSGVELSTPSAVDAERSRVKTPAEFTPQLQKKKPA